MTQDTFATPRSDLILSRRFGDHAYCSLWTRPFKAQRGRGGWGGGAREGGGGGGRGIAANGVVGEKDCRVRPELGFGPSWRAGRDAKREHDKDKDLRFQRQTGGMK